jgi:S1-C subfamily serine protease
MMALRSEVLAGAAAVKRAESQGIGLHVTALTAENRETFGVGGNVTGALIDQVTDGSQAETAGLVPGDVIVQTGNRPVTQPEDVTPGLSYGADVHGSLVALLVHGKSATRWVSLYVGRVDVSELLTAPMMAAKPSPVGDAAAKPRSGEVGK